MRIYLCGTITADPATHSWREDAVFFLEGRGHKALNPLRGKDLKSIDTLGFKSNIDPILFVERDEKDLRSTDVVLAYFLGIETLVRQSIGSWCELGFARALQKPLIVVATHPNVLEHPFILKWATAVVPTLQEGLDAALWLDD